MAEHVDINTDSDVVLARKTAKEVASVLSFTPVEMTELITAVSEIARNILTHASHGTMEFTLVSRGIEVLAIDAGPGIRDIHAAMQDGWSSRNGLGLGLPGARRLTDEFEVTSTPGQGTTVRMIKWKR